MSRKYTPIKQYYDEMERLHQEGYRRAMVYIFNAV